MKNIKKFILISILFVLFFIISATSYANTITNSLSDTFFRLHIIANSDSANDQELKLKIRDEIIKYMNSLISKEENLSKQNIINICNDNLIEFENIQLSCKSIYLKFFISNKRIWKYFFTCWKL